MSRSNIFSSPGCPPLELELASGSSRSKVFSSPPSVERRDQDRSRSLEQEQLELEQALSLSQQEPEGQEARDLERALALSQGLVETYQEEEDPDLALARRLQQELDSEPEQEDLPDPDDDDHRVKLLRKLEPEQEWELPGDPPTKRPRVEEGYRVSSNISIQGAEAILVEDDEECVGGLTIVSKLGGGGQNRRGRGGSGDGGGAGGRARDAGGMTGGRSLLTSPERKERDGEGSGAWASDALNKYFAKDKVFGARGRGRGGGGRRGSGRGEGTSKATPEKAGGSKGSKLRGSSARRTPQKKTPGSSRRKEYVPKARSGAYAVLVCLKQEEEQDGWQGWLTKQEIQTRAQHLCDESLTNNSVHR